MASLHATLAQVDAESAVKEKIDLTKVLAFFSTELGQLLLSEEKRVYREAPFAMLKEDAQSGESFVVRGILDGYLVLDDRILLFDYKTDHYQHPSQLVDRYRDQLGLYAEALSRSYGFDRVDKYLILLGGETIQVVEVDDGKS